MPNTPEPVPDRMKHVGGIESIVLDGSRRYFGFDYRSDLVLSPLIDDPKTMAEFASMYMRQLDGDHDAAFWSELVEDSVTTSDLTEDDADREFTTEGLRARPADADGHLEYLLSALDGCPGWEPVTGPLAENGGQRS